MLEALKKSLGNVTTAVKLAEVGRTTFYEWMKTDEAFAARVQDNEAYVFDFVESKIMEQIKSGNTTMIIFFAKTRMKSRGYVERTEFQAVEGIKIEVADPGALDLLNEISEIEHG